MDTWNLKIRVVKFSEKNFIIKENYWEPLTLMLKVMNKNEKKVVNNMYSTL